ncbi:FBP domain-containing protein [Micromonospora sp. BL4]|uniref:FBP domain-containing protein n=1 Tax=Micromonospora sp. BL4 TaxID=2478710 RepID=UPI000EF589EC|nr:FBP domain-containing protein [Micromonospora sp. BL4]RLP94334.1 FBP domain-containing protein [Micromonospora sp. BL4]
MLAITERAIRASFVNCTQGEAKRLAVPNDLETRPWGDLDFLGWRDPAATQRAYLVAESDTGLVGVALRVAPQQTGRVRRSMCSLCLTTHTGDGVALMTARKAGRDGRQGNSVGAYICSDLACSLYLRGRKDAGRRIDETITLAEKVERTTNTLTAFLRKVIE